MTNNTGKMISPALDVGLVANDFEAMMAFYREGLGMLEIDKFELPGTLLTRFQAGPGVLKFNQQPAHTPVLDLGEFSSSRGMKLVTIAVPDLQATSKKLQAAGFPELTIQDMGHLSVAFTKDPNNSPVELLGIAGSAEEPAIQAIGFTVGDMDASRSFFTDVLGFTEGSTEPIPSLNTDKVEFAAGATTLKLWQINNLPAHTGPIQAYAGIRYLTAVVDEMDAVISRAHGAGHPVPLAPTEIAPGLHIAMIEDPDGNWFELVEIKQA